MTGCTKLICNKYWLNCCRVANIATGRAITITYTTGIIYCRTTANAITVKFLSTISFITRA